MEHTVPAIEIAAALAQLAQGGSSLLLKHQPTPRKDISWMKEDKGQRDGRGRDKPTASRRRSDEERRPKRKDSPPEKGLERFRIEVGHNDSVMPGNIVGAIANESGLTSKDIGRINIFDSYSTVDLPLDMPDDIFKDLKNTWVTNKKLNITRHSAEKDLEREEFKDADAGDRPMRRKPKLKKKKKKKKKKIKRVRVI